MSAVTTMLIFVWVMWAEVVVLERLDFFNTAFARSAGTGVVHSLRTTPYTTCP